jgi:hypothetical protein
MKPKGKATVSLSPKQNPNQNEDKAMGQTRIERVAGFFPDLSDPSSINLTDELALDRAYDSALDQFCLRAQRCWLAGTDRHGKTDQ